MPAWVLGKLTPRQGLHCRGMLASILGVHPLAEGRERGRIQGMCSHNKGLKWLLGELWGWGGPSGLSWFVGKKLGLSTFMLLLGDMALGRVLFVRPIQTGLRVGCLQTALPAAEGIRSPILKAFWGVPHCVPSRPVEIFQTEAKVRWQKSLVLYREQVGQPCSVVQWLGVWTDCRVPVLPLSSCLTST